MSWSIVRLEELYAEPSRNGIYKSKEYQGTGTPVVKMNELFDNRRIHAGDLNLDRLQLSPQELQRFCLNTDDLLFARTSVVPEGVGKCSLICSVEGDLAFGSNLIRARIDESKANPAYLFYYFQSPSGRGRILAISNGVAVRTIRGSDLKNINIKLPRRKTQEHIASILSSYDDLIENNLRRIQLLEQAARLLYKEWFVHLRFPGHERVSITDGVPEGWEKKKIEDVCKTVGGGTPSTKVSEYWGGDITWVIPSDITKNDCLALLDSERKITEKGLRESSAKMVPAETILMTSRASVGFFALMDREVCTNQGLINIIPHEDELRMYLMFNLMSRVTEIRSNAKGTTYPEISKGRFRGMDIVVPSKTLVNEFSRVATVITQQVRCLKRSTLHLEAARDLFLPRLMNGKLSV